MWEQRRSASRLGKAAVIEIFYGGLRAEKIAKSSPEAAACATKCGQCFMIKMSRRIVSSKVDSQAKKCVDGCAGHVIYGPLGAYSRVVMLMFSCGAAAKERWFSMGALQKQLKRKLER